MKVIQNMIFINEYNFYYTIFSSRKPEAEEFKHYVAGLLVQLRDLSHGDRNYLQSQINELKENQNNLISEFNSQKNFRDNQIENIVNFITENCILL